MTIIVQKNRILINGFDESRREDFVKTQKIFQPKMPIGWEEKWVSIYQNVKYEGKNYWAVARQTLPKDIIYHLGQDDRDVIRDDYHIKPRKMQMKMREGFGPRNALQERLLDFMDREKSYSALKDKPRRAMIADTGEGKTFLTISSIIKNGKVAAILCPDERAIKTWLEEFLKFTEVSESGDEFFVVQGKDSIQRAIKNKSKIKVVLFSEATIGAAFRSGSEGEILKIFEELGVGIKVIDELHLNLVSVFFTEMLIVTEQSGYL